MVCLSATRGEGCRSPVTSLGGEEAEFIWTGSKIVLRQYNQIEPRQVKCNYGLVTFKQKKKVNSEVWEKEKQKYIDISFILNVCISCRRDFKTASAGLLKRARGWQSRRQLKRVCSEATSQNKDRLLHKANAA